MKTSTVRAMVSIISREKLDELFFFDELFCVELSSGEVFSAELFSSDELFNLNLFNLLKYERTRYAPHTEPAILPLRSLASWIYQPPAWMAANTDGNVFTSSQSFAGQ